MLEKLKVKVKASIRSTNRLLMLERKRERAAHKAFTKVPSWQKAGPGGLLAIPVFTGLYFKNVRHLR